MRQFRIEQGKHHMRHHRRGPDGHSRGRRGRSRGPRAFDYGELRLLILAKIEHAPSHGYELIKAIEDQLGGTYTPSPGVIYPTMTWLEDMNYAEAKVEDGGRKRYAITETGQQFLTENRKSADELLARTAVGSGRTDVPVSITRAMENVRTALKLKIRAGDITNENAEVITNALDQVAKTIEQA